MEKKIKHLYLARHGQTNSNAQGVLQGKGVNDPLNELVNSHILKCLSYNIKGIQQATYLRDELSQIPFEIIITSKLLRAKQTAEIVAQCHPDVPIIEIEDLNEISWGEWEGTETGDIKSLLSSWEKGDFEGDFHSTFIMRNLIILASSPMGESPIQVEKRSVPIIYSILDRPESHFLFVLHGRLLRIILSSILYKSLHKMQSFTHHNTSVNYVQAVLEEPESTVDSNTMDSKESSSNSWQHPSHVTFVPVYLDNRNHLPIELQGR